MSSDTVAYLSDIVAELDDVIAFTVDGQTAFEQDVKTQKAVVRSYEIIGEICKRLPADVREENPQIDWRRLISFREFLAHNYESIALSYIWAAVEDAPRLKTAVQTIIDGLEASSS